MRIPLFVRILHSNLLLAGKNSKEVPDRDTKASKQRRQISFLGKRQFRTGNSVCHGIDLFRHYCENDGYEKDIHQRNLEEEIPAKPHQLVISETR